MEKTVRLFDADAYLHEFDAEVISSVESDGEYLTVLDRTAFFPEEGGQSCDRGTIANSRVSYVFEKDGVIYHRTGRLFDEGERVRGAIDFDERYRKMQSHTGEHVLCGTAHRLWGAENVGFHLSEEYVRVDLDVYLDHEKAAYLEREANRVIRENHLVTAWYPTAEELGSVDFRSKEGIVGDVRLVKIGSVDVCACCAPHVGSTAEVGVLKIVDSIKYKGGTRLEIVCGPDSVELFIKEHADLSELAASYSVKREELKDAVRRQREELAAVTYKLRRAEKELMAKELEGLCETERAVCFFYDDADVENVREFLNGAAAKCFAAAGFIGSDGNYRFIVRSDKTDLRARCREINDAIGGRGGGQPLMIQGSCTADRRTIEEFFASFE